MSLHCSTWWCECWFRTLKKSCSQTHMHLCFAQKVCLMTVKWAIFKLVLQGTLFVWAHIEDIVFSYEISITYWHCLDLLQPLMVTALILYTMHMAVITTSLLGTSMSGVCANSFPIGMLLLEILQWSMYLLTVWCPFWFFGVFYSWYIY